MRNALWVTVHHPCPLESEQLRGALIRALGIRPTAEASDGDFWSKGREIAESALYALETKPELSWQTEDSITGERFIPSNRAGRTSIRMTVLGHKFVRGLRGEDTVPEHGSSDDRASHGIRRRRLG
jgi:hypothetical protein